MQVFSTNPPCRRFERVLLISLLFVPDDPKNPFLMWPPQSLLTVFLFLQGQRQPLNCSSFLLSSSNLFFNSEAMITSLMVWGLIQLFWVVFLMLNKTISQKNKNGNQTNFCKKISYLHIDCFIFHKRNGICSG